MVYLVLQQNTHGTAPTSFALAAFACITVRLWAVNALRIWPQLHSHFYLKQGKEQKPITVELDRPRYNTKIKNKNMQLLSS